ncbi:hypothetical protein [Rhizobium sp. IMFF44]|uniref:hypothetical protein n=1 Tax=unclassified Rhizobium TaxID=2613769 RepID=UPI0013AF83B1|nr:hypothetical protein [Rhizobium sp. CNPSo 4062]
MSGMGRHRWVEARLEMRRRVEAAKAPAAGMKAAMKTAAAKIHAGHPAAKAAPRFGDIRRNKSRDQKCG